MDKEYNKYYKEKDVIDFIRSYRHSTDVAFDMEEHMYEIPEATMEVEDLKAEISMLTSANLAIQRIVKSEDIITIAEAIEKIKKLQKYKLAPELEELVCLEDVIAILEGRYKYG